ncbi:MAG: L,D-transpeptidase [Chloroflexota bacterium]|nr:L,D-transpeptidase [Chloroflexota bacterium]
MTFAITRRKLLKLIAATTASAALSPVFHARAHYTIPPDPDDELDSRKDDDYAVDINSWVQVGRAIHSVTFYDQPATSATRLRTRHRDQSFVIVGEVRAPFSTHNDLWYKTTLGYVHSAWVLPIRVYPPQPFIQDVGEWGFWGEVSQVFTGAHAEPHPQSRQVYRFYGGTVYHIVDAFKDEHGTGWYKVFDEFPPTNPTHQWVLARDVHRIPRSEMAPIHPFAGEKRIEVDLEKQRLDCYEGSRLVFTTLVASGLGRFEGDAATDLATHRGETSVLLKQPSRHMSNRPYPGGPPLVGDIFDLPGIPWNIFFDLSGTAIHGTYWHNDFGIRRSHGCLNVSCEAARWIYRWVYPVSGYEDDFIQSDRQVGTPINIF